VFNGTSDIKARTSSVTLSIAESHPKISDNRQTESRTLTMSESRPILTKYSQSDSITHSKSESLPYIFDTSKVYNYYTPLAGMFIGFEHYTHPFKSESTTLSKSESYPSVDYIVQGHSDSVTLSKSESRPFIRKFVNNPRKYTQSTPIYYYDKDE